MAWYHPKYYKELRKIRAASFKQQASGELQATSLKQAIQETVPQCDIEEAKPEPTGPGSQKPQATSSKNRDPL